MLQLVGGVSTVLPANVGEYIFFFLAILLGTALMAAVQGVIFGVVTNGDPDEILWKQNLDALNFMMSDTALPQRVHRRHAPAASRPQPHALSLTPSAVVDCMLPTRVPARPCDTCRRCRHAQTRLAVRKFFRNSKRLFKRRSYDMLTSDCLSPELQRQVRYQIASSGEIHPTAFDTASPLQVLPPTMPMPMMTMPTLETV